MILSSVYMRETAEQKGVIYYVFLFLQNIRHVTNNPSYAWI